MSYHWTSEAVGPGHPDKVADQISDAILDAYLEHDSDAKVACETLVKGNHVILAGEVTSTDKVDLDAVVRQTIKGIGYTSQRNLGFDENCKITNLVGVQSSEINNAVVGGSETGAGDQGIMFGYADNSGENYMPLAISAARKIIAVAQNTVDPRVSGLLFPDCKSQVTFEHHDDGTPIQISHIVLSMHHDINVSLDTLRKVYHEVMLPNLGLDIWINKHTKHHINPGGAWHDGGPAFDAGLTGRKIVADNYGADCQIGGGAFSGKDPTKVDRSAAYAARHIAKNIVAFGLAEKAKIQLSYAIGEPNPISVHIDTMGTCREYLDDADLANVVYDNWDLTPDGIAKKFELKSAIYGQTAKIGHFGINPKELPNGKIGWLWEKVDAEFLKGIG